MIVGSIKYWMRSRSIAIEFPVRTFCRDTGLSALHAVAWRQTKKETFSYLVIPPQQRTLPQHATNPWVPDQTPGANAASSPYSSNVALADFGLRQPWKDPVLRPHKRSS